MDNIGVIHGRFQVLHLDHLKYLLAGKELCRHLVVGITNPDPFLTRAEEADPDRSDPPANPLNYFERYQMVKAVLREAGLDFREFSIVPLPINMPERYQYYVPADAVFFLSIYDDWGRRKLRYFQKMGLKTHVLWEVSPEEKGISGREVRERMRGGQPWQHMVPPGVSLLMEKWEIPERLKQLFQNTERA
ncbi:MAG: nicotinate-nucleotide adenylyltransferase [Desulfococcaceae bacterium]|jgi:nicotinamide-nucleotide adenylyltransferase|nr:nicotinate-nucleotide adenylyltransferase [Desulfococcaceae bacterium]